jgi:hypothetical protein
MFWKSHDTSQKSAFLKLKNVNEVGTFETVFQIDIIWKKFNSKSLTAKKMFSTVSNYSSERVMASRPTA